jgi:hypothetical protein
MSVRASFHSPSPTDSAAALSGRVIVLGSLMLVLAATLLFGVTPSVASAAIPTLTRAEIIARAESGLGASYTWGHESWTPNLGSGAGPDCSGYALKCWETPRTLLYQEEDGQSASIYPRYTSYDFFNSLGPWYALGSRSLLLEGDVLVKNNGTSGHVVIYAGGDAWNAPIIYEAPGTGLSVRKISRYLGSEYQPRRRESLVTSGIILDNPTAKSTGGDDLSGNWTRSTSTPGYYGDSYQVRAATTATSWARWTPRFPASGYYNVYLRWTSHPNRASAANLHVNTPSGQYNRWVNQRVNGGTWYLLGRYYFAAGYSTGSGSISIFATGADGYVVADAVKFVPTK